MSWVLYGLPNCDSTMAAKKALENAGIKFAFHDIRIKQLEEKKLKLWIEKAGWEKLLNKRSTTWKQLPETSKNFPLTDESVQQLIMEHITLMKRPVLEADEKLLIGKEAII